MSTLVRDEQVEDPQQELVVGDRLVVGDVGHHGGWESVSVGRHSPAGPGRASGEQASLSGVRAQGGVQGESIMERPMLVIAVPYDGIAEAHNGRERLAFESLVRALLDYEKIPATLCFYTEGVRWVTRDSPLLQELQEIRARGADIVACRASMAQAGLLQELAVGRLDTPDHIDDLLIDAQHAVVV